MSAPEHDDHQDDDQGGEVLPFPLAAPHEQDTGPSTAVEPAAEVLDAEIVDEQEDTQHKPVVRVTAQRVAGAASSPRAISAGRATARAGLTISQGFASWTRRGWDALTPAQRRVAALAAQGLSNAQIAERLIVTPETVKGHVAKVLAKLGVSSRHQLREPPTLRTSDGATKTADPPGGGC